MQTMTDTYAKQFSKHRLHTYVSLFLNLSKKYPNYELTSYCMLIFAAFCIVWFRFIPCVFLSEYAPLCFLIVSLLITLQFLHFSTNIRNLRLPFYAGINTALYHYYYLPDFQSYNIYDIR